MKEVKNRWMIPCFGLTLLLSIVLGATLLVSYPAVWNPMYKLVMKDTLVEKGATGDKLDAVIADANKISGGLWNETPYSEISNDLNFVQRNGVTISLKEEEVSHYEDVRDMISLAQKVTYACLGISLFGFIMVGWRRIWNAAFASFVLLGLIAGVWMLINWHSLFKALHWVIFQDASWKLPDGSYSLSLFPHRIWQVTGGVVGVLVFVVLIIGLVLARKSEESRR